MTLPARDRPGPLGRRTILNGNSAEFRDFRSSKPMKEFTIVVRTDQAITFRVYRIDSYGNASLAIAPLAIPAMTPSNDEQTIVLDYPLPGQGIRCFADNASGFTAHVQAEAAAAGQGSAGVAG